MDLFPLVDPEGLFCFKLASMDDCLLLTVICAARRSFRVIKLLQIVILDCVRSWCCPAVYVWNSLSLWYWSVLALGDFCDLLRSTSHLTMLLCRALAVALASTSSLVSLAIVGRFVFSSMSIFLEMWPYQKSLCQWAKSLYRGIDFFLLSTILFPRSVDVEVFSYDALLYRSFTL